MSEELKARSRRFFEEVYNQRNLDLIEEFVAAEYVRYDPSVPGGKAIGIGALRSFAAMYLSAVPDLPVSIDAQIAEGNKAVTRWTGSGTEESRELGQLTACSAFSSSWE